jgi:hypothetical protein
LCTTFLDHCIDENHNDADRNLDAEVLYWQAQPRRTTAANRRTLTTGNGHTLAGATRIFNDSKNAIWTDLQYGTFTKPVSTLSLTKVPSNRNICGYGNSKNAQATLVTNPVINTTGVQYQWSWVIGSDIYISNNATFSGQGTNTLSIKNNDPSIVGNVNVNNMQVRCAAYLNSCKTAVPSDTFLFKASANVVLQPTPSRCMNGSVQWLLPKPTPADGTFTAYNMASPNTPITNIVNSATYRSSRSQL